MAVLAEMAVLAAIRGLVEHPLTVLVLQPALAMVRAEAGHQLVAVVEQPEGGLAH